MLRCFGFASALVHGLCWQVGEATVREQVCSRAPDVGRHSPLLCHALPRFRQEALETPAQVHTGKGESGVGGLMEEPGGIVWRPSMCRRW